MESLCEQNRLLIYRCFNVLNREAELSGPQVMTYLMNWGDRFVSHQYVSVYWCQLANALEQVYPHLRVNGREEMDDEIDEDNFNHSEVEVNFIYLFHSQIY